jgi:RHS repeat-associated protein
VSNFTYDDTDQLVDAEHSYQDQESFTYDDNGNRINTGYVTGENNQLLSDGKFNYQYDKEGNRVKRTEIATGEVTEYQWDHRNRLVAAVTKSSNGNVIANSEYTYDVNNNRIAKSVDADGAGAGSAVVERYVLDGDHIALTFDGEGNQTERFLHGTQVDQVLAQENADGEVLWALTDHQNSVRIVLDHDGKIVNQISYDSFGQITNETHSDVEFRFGYTGRELDSETGLYYNRARYYDPAVGEFVSEDPIGFAAGDGNLSRYVGNNPLFYLDPTGFCGVGSSGEPEFFGPAFGPNSNPGGSFPTPDSVLENLSKNNQRHLKKHLPQFQELDPTINAESLRDLGASIVQPENLVSSPNADQLVFDKVININGASTKVRAVLNRDMKLRSVQIRDK